MGLWSDNITAGFFVSFIVDVFVPDIGAAAQHCLPKMLKVAPQRLFLKKYFDVTAHPEAKWHSQQNILIFCFLFH